MRSRVQIPAPRPSREMGRPRASHLRICVASTGRRPDAAGLFSDPDDDHYVRAVRVGEGFRVRCRAIGWTVAQGRSSEVVVPGRRLQRASGLQDGEGTLVLHEFGAGRLGPAGRRAFQAHRQTETRAYGADEVDEFGRVLAGQVYGERRARDPEGPVDRVEPGELLDLVDEFRGLFLGQRPEGGAVASPRRRWFRWWPAAPVVSVPTTVVSVPDPPLSTDGAEVRKATYVGAWALSNARTMAPGSWVGGKSLSALTVESTAPARAVVVVAAAAVVIF